MRGWLSGRQFGLARGSPRVVGRKALPSALKSVTQGLDAGPAVRRIQGTSPEIQRSRSLMRIINRIIALTRSVQLNRQFREIERAIGELPLSTRRQLATLAVKEFANTTQCEHPHLYGTPTEQTTNIEPWGKGTELG